MKKNEPRLLVAHVQREEETSNAVGDDTEELPFGSPEAKIKKRVRLESTDASVGFPEEISDRCDRTLGMLRRGAMHRGGLGSARMGCEAQLNSEVIRKEARSGWDRLPLNRTAHGRMEPCRWGKWAYAAACLSSKRLS